MVARILFLRSAILLCEHQIALSIVIEVTDLFNFIKPHNNPYSVRTECH
jgi:hypothetical protein